MKTLKKILMAALTVLAVNGFAISSASASFWSDIGDAFDKVDDVRKKYTVMGQVNKKLSEKLGTPESGLELLEKSRIPISSLKEQLSHSSSGPNITTQAREMDAYLREISSTAVFLASGNDTVVISLFTAAASLSGIGSTVSADTLRQEVAELSQITKQVNSLPINNTLSDQAKSRVLKKHYAAYRNNPRLDNAYSKAQFNLAQKINQVNKAKAALKRAQSDRQTFLDGLEKQFKDVDYAKKRVRHMSKTSAKNIQELEALVKRLQQDEGMLYQHVKTVTIERNQFELQLKQLKNTYPELKEI